MLEAEAGPTIDAIARHIVVLRVLFHSSPGFLATVNPTSGTIGRRSRHGAHEVFTMVLFLLRISLVGSDV